MLVGESKQKKVPCRVQLVGHTACLVSPIHLKDELAREEAITEFQKSYCQLQNSLLFTSGCKRKKKQENLQKCR